VWARLNLNPHPLKTEGAAPRGRCARIIAVDGVEFKPAKNDRGYGVPLIVEFKSRSGRGDLADMGRSVLRPYTKLRRASPTRIWSERWPTLGRVVGRNSRIGLGEGGAEAADYAILAEGDHGVEQGGGDGLADDGDAGGVDEEAGFYAGGIGYGAGRVIAGVVIPLG
jgi:hypothetical protein